LVGAAAGGPIVGILAGILAALIWPRLSEWWHTKRYLQAIERQEKFLEEYDVYAVSSADYMSFRSAVFGETDPSKALLMDRRAMRLAKRLYPTKAKTAADKKSAWDAEEDRRRRLGLPTQEEARNPGVAARYYKPHYQHLKAGIKDPSCLLCDRNNEEMDRHHLEIYGRAEQEAADFALIGMKMPELRPNYSCFYNTNRFEVSKAADSAMKQAGAPELVKRISEARDRIIASGSLWS
jgi:hypothetical protein